MKQVYILLAIAGAVLPYSQFIPFLQENGLNIALFTSQLFATDISSFFAIDFLISCFIFWIFLYEETRRLHIKYWWLCIIATLTIGLSFALPLFLYMRRVAIERESTHSTIGK